MKRNAFDVAMAASLMNSTVNLGLSMFTSYDNPRSGQHPHRNDVNRHGLPIKKKGNKKQKTNPYA